MVCVVTYGIKYDISFHMHNNQIICLIFISPQIPLESCYLKDVQKYLANIC